MSDALLERRRFLAFALALGMLSEVLSFAGVGMGVHSFLASCVSPGNGFFSACLFAGAVVHAASRPQHLRAFLGAGIVAELLQALLRGHEGYLMNAGAMFGLLALGFTGWEVARTRSREAELAFYEVALFPTLFLAAVLPLELTITLHPTTLDGRAFLADLTLFGGEPAWAVGRFFHESRATLIFEVFIYMHLPVAAGAIYALERQTGRKNDLQVAFVAAGIVGILLLHLAPVAGPSSFRPLFPQLLPDTDDALGAMYIAGTRWRNSIPSMHTTWALFIYWHARPFGRWGRLFGAMWLVTTIIAMLGLGEHFLVDVAISVPFAVAMRALLARSAERRARLRAGGVGTAFYLAWLVLLRTPLLGDEWFLRVFAFAGVASSLALVTRVGETTTPTPLRPLPLASADLARAALGFAGGVVGLAIARWVGVAALALMLGASGEGMLLAGAGAGVLVAAYALFPIVGIVGSAIGALAIGGLLLLRVERPPPRDRPTIALVLVALACGALAVVERHVIALIAGSSFYAHACISAAALFGVAVGARLRLSRLQALAGLVVAVVILRFTWPSVPVYFGEFHDFVEPPKFATSELVRFVVIALLVVVPAAFAGRALGKGGLAAAGGGALGMLLGTLLLGSVGATKLFHLDPSVLARGENVYFARQGYGPTIAVAEDATAWTTVTQATDRRALLVNGKFAADDKADGELGAQIAFAELSLLHAKEHAHVLVAGVGTGATAHAFTAAGARVDLVDPAPGADRLARDYFGADPGLTVSGVDPRAALDKGPFDVIAIETPTAWFDGAARLYSEGFYAKARASLAPGGAFQQWIQLHRVDGDDLASMLATIHRAFPEIWVYIAQRQGIVVACPSACPAARDARQVLDPRGVERFLATKPTVPITTDLYPWLELHAPRGNMRAYDATLRANEALLRSFSAN